MKVYSELDLKSFKFWSGAKETAALLSFEELDTMEQEIEALFIEELSETAINDLFWFDTEFIEECIGRKLYDDE